MPDLALSACRPAPLASYLKAVGVLRVVGDQVDPTARGFWQREAFVLRSGLDRDALERFLLQEYVPAAIVAPWNGGSGFFPNDSHEAITAIEGAAAERLRPYREVIGVARLILARLGFREKPAKDAKPRLLEACRAGFPDHGLPWLDAAFLLTSRGPLFPPLLGTGGNDGRLDFTNNFMQRVLDVMQPASGEPTPAAMGLLRSALFDAPTSHLASGAVGQFSPGDAGGANAAAGFDGDAQVNPWDFLLMLEGATLFAVAPVRRMERETAGALSYPFTVRPAGVGYSTASSSDEGAARGEIWLPLWSRPGTVRELRMVLAEGRARVAGRSARTGVDFARAVATLGVDRGIPSFERYGFLKRNGLSYLATRIGRFEVLDRPAVRLLDEIDDWLDTFRRRATGERAPAAVRRSLQVLEKAILDLCRQGGPDRVQGVLVALGGCERAMARSLRWASDPKTRLAPVPPLSPRWLGEADDGSAELRLAAALGSIAWAGMGADLPFRCHLEPVATSVRRNRLHVEWHAGGERDVVFPGGDVPAGLNAVMARRLLRALQNGGDQARDRGAQPARLADIAAFIEGRTDDSRLTDLLWGACLVDWSRRHHAPFKTIPSGPLPAALYGALKLCFEGTSARGTPVPLVPRLHRLAARGAGAEASRAAIQRLRANGHFPALSIVQQRGDPVRRIGAALLFPLDAVAIGMLRRTVLRPTTSSGENAP